MQKEVAGEILSVVDRLRFREELHSRPRETRSAMSKQLERWDSELEAERSARPVHRWNLAWGHRYVRKPRETSAAVGYGRNAIFGRQQRQFHGVGNSVSKRRDTGQTAGDPKFIFCRREPTSIARARLPDGESRMLAIL